MNLIGSLIAWVMALGNSPFLKGVGQFILSIMHDELPVAEQLIEKIAASLPADMASAKPLVALGVVASAAAAQAEKDGITVGVGAVSMAAVNYVNGLQNAKPITSVDQGPAVAQAQAEYDQTVAAAKKKLAQAQEEADKAAKAAAAAAQAKVAS